MADCIVAFDPGATGAVAFYFPDNRHHVAVEDLPLLDKRNLNGAALTVAIERFAPTFAVIEEVSAMKGWGGASGFKFGRNFGTILGIVAGLKIPHQMVRPTKWKTHFGLSSDKALSRRRATELFPALAERFVRVKDDGRAEAALLALYAAETMVCKAREAA